VTRVQTSPPRDNDCHVRMAWRSAAVCDYDVKFHLTHIRH